MLRTVFFIGLGSFLGGISRWLLSVFFQKFSFYHYPIGTFIVNILGCLFIGIFYALFEKYNVSNQSLRLFLTVGFCGSFTTFSTFMNENVSLLQNEHLAVSIIYTCISIVLGLLSVVAGTAIAKHML